MKHKGINESGQALLLVLLSMAAIVTIILSVTSRSVTDISITSSEEDALRAFSAAEAGIERSLLAGVGTSGSPDSNDSSVSYVSTIVPSAGGESFKYPGSLFPGESATFWLVSRDSNGNMVCPDEDNCYSGNKISDICWGVNSSYSADETPAIMISLYYDWNPTGTGSIGNLISSGGTDFTHVKVVRRGYDPNDSRNINAGATGNHFFDSKNGGSCKVGGTDFAFHTGSILFTTDSAQIGNPGFIKIPGSSCWSDEGCLLMIKVRVVYNNPDPSKREQIAVIMGGGGGGILPPQGNIIESVGVAGTSTRKVNVFQSYSEPPSIFDAAVFSSSDFTK